MFLSYGKMMVFGVVASAVLCAGTASADPFKDGALKGRAGDIPILLYHHIGYLPESASRAQKRWTISPEKFESQIEWIASRGYHPVTMRQLIGHLKHGDPLPLKPIAITFDDGWKDQYAAAFPVLKKHSFPATFFIITDSVGHSAYMNWAQVQELSAFGMDMEPHSHTHLRLSVLPHDLARKEIVQSIKLLEEHLKVPSVVFAYPFGSYGDAVIEIVKEAGLEGAVTVDGLNGGYLFREDQSFTLTRCAIEGEDDIKGIGRLQDKGGAAADALFVSVVQDPLVLSSKEEIVKLVDFAEQAGIKTLFVQVYRANKAWFPTKVADQSPYLECLKSTGEDPFALLITMAHSKGIQVHAWMNLLSLSQNPDSTFVKKYGLDILTRNVQKKRKLQDYKIDAQYFLEPGDLRVRSDLVELVGEVVRAYPGLDGVQLDYIRYPDSEPHYGYTKTNIQRFKRTTGLRSIDDDSAVWKEWKRTQVTELVTLLSQKARSLHPGIQVSATGCMPYVRAYHEAFQDWPSWLDKGIVDFVTVMNYSQDPAEFEHWLAAAKEKVPDFSRVKIGVGAYKLGDAPAVFSQEVAGSRDAGGCAIFHYGSVRDNPKLKELLIGRGKGPGNS